MELPDEGAGNELKFYEWFEDIITGIFSDAYLSYMWNEGYRVMTSTVSICLIRN